MSNIANGKTICQNIKKQFGDQVKCIAKDNIVKVRVMNEIDYSVLSKFPIQELSIYTSNQITDLPKELEVLKIQDSYKLPLPATLPEKLEVLVIGNGFNHSLPALNEHLKMLQLGNSFNRRLKLSKADNLSILVLGESFNQKIIYLPDKLKKIVIKNPNYSFKLPLSKFNIQLFDTIDVYGLTNKNLISKKINEIKNTLQQPSLTLPNTETYYDSLNYFTNKPNISKVVEPYSQFMLRPHYIEKQQPRIKTNAKFLRRLPSFNNFLAGKSKKEIQQPMQLIRRTQLKEKVNKLKKQAENYRQKSKEKSKMADNLLQAFSLNQEISENVENKLNVLLKHEKMLKQEANKINKQIYYLEELAKSTLFGQGNNFYQKYLDSILSDDTVEPLVLKNNKKTNISDVAPTFSESDYKSQLLYRKHVANKIKKLQNRADFYRKISKEKSNELSNILKLYPNKNSVPANIANKLKVLENHAKLFEKQIDQIGKKVKELSNSLPNAFDVQLLRRTQIQEKIQELKKLVNKYNKISTGQNTEYSFDSSLDIQTVIRKINKKIQYLEELYKSTLFGRGDLNYQKYLNELLANENNQVMKYAIKKNTYVTPFNVISTTTNTVQNTNPFNPFDN